MASRPGWPYWPRRVDGAANGGGEKADTCRIVYCSPPLLAAIRTTGMPDGHSFIRRRGSFLPGRLGSVCGGGGLDWL